MKSTYGKYKEICGEFISIDHDPKVKVLNTSLAVDAIGSPIVVLQDWSKEDKSKDLLVLHIHDVVRLKAVFDSLILNATLFDSEYIKELMVEAEQKMLKDRPAKKKVKKEIAIKTKIIKKKVVKKSLVKKSLVKKSPVKKSPVKKSPVKKAKK